MLESAYKRIAVDGHRDNPDDICESARSAWLDYKFGIPRVSGRFNRTRHVHHGMKRKLGKDDGNEASFIRARRQKLENASSLSRPRLSDVAADIEALDAKCWSDEHAKELQFAIAKRDDRAGQAISEGVLPKKYQTERMVQISKHREAKMVENDVKRVQANARHRIALEGADLPTRDDFRNMRVYIDDPSWASLLISWQMQRVWDRCEASVFVVMSINMTSVTNLNILAASLMGGYVINQAVLTGGNDAVSIKFNAALRLQRMLYVSDGFATKHHKIYDVIMKCMASMSGCRWQLLKDLAKYENAVANRMKGVMVLTTQADKRNQDVLGANAWCVYTCGLCGASSYSANHVS
jgi:hypothetical protein